MRAGQLDRIIEVQDFVAGEPNPWGEVEYTWATFATLRAQIIQETTEEFLRNYGVTAEQAIIFRTRYVEGISTLFRVQYEGRQFNIREVKEIGRRKGLDIRCVGLAA
jgi:SPP1 family predicted phage head-tail adaptor